MLQTTAAIKQVGLVTLELEVALEESWEIVKRTSAENSIENVDKRAVTKENVTVFMSSVEMKVAELLLETGNAPDTPQSSFAQNVAKPAEMDFTKMPQMSEEQFNEEMNQENDDEEGDVMFMSMQDFKNKLDMMSAKNSQ